MEETFVTIYEKKIWGGESGSSGPGSTFEINAKHYIPFLTEFIREKEIKTIVDLGCGDFQIGTLIYDELDIHYTGYDVYKKLIDSHNSKFIDTTKYTFLHLDFCNKKESIVSGDLCILKDVLQHWSSKDIYTFLDYLVDTKKFKYILVCNCNYQKEGDIETGGFRPLTCEQFPLRKYNPIKYLQYSTKEVSIIEIPQDPIVIAILAKDKAYSLPFYLKCILQQFYSKKNIHLYIRTNDNTDPTTELLKAFIATYGSQYASVFFDDTSISETLKKYSAHEWNTERFKILGKIRQESIQYAVEKKAHYFVADCDNFITPTTISTLFANSHNGVIAPMLITDKAYSNYHYDIDVNGYYKEHEFYMKVLQRKIKGLIQVPVVHCTYFIHNKFLKDIVYDDKSCRHEYVIFSNILRKKGISQYLDNRTFYGIVEFSTGDECKKRYNTLWKPYQKEFGIEWL
jgi:hypothetical protein